MGGVMTLGPPVWTQCKEDAIVLLEIDQQGAVEKLPACHICWQECVNTPAIKVLKAEPIAPKMKETADAE